MQRFYMVNNNDLNKPGKCLAKLLSLESGLHDKFLQYKTNSDGELSSKEAKTWEFVKDYEGFCQTSPS